jgi:hypothetical protein
MDDSIVIRLHYDEEGRFLRAEQVEDVIFYRRQRDMVLAHSIRLKEYLAKL